MATLVVANLTLVRMVPYLGTVSPMPTWLEEHSSPELEMAMRIVREGAKPILVLHGLAVLSREIDRLVEEAVGDCRNQEKHSWAEIGETMGVSRQAARRRFLHVDGFNNVDEDKE